MKGMRVAGVGTLEEANAYLENEYLPWWNKALIVLPANASDAHRRLGHEHDLAAILSHVEQRQVTNDYTIRWDGKFYPIDRRDVRAGMRKANVRVEQRWDGSLAVRFQERYVRVRRCAQPVGELQPPIPAAVKPPKSSGRPKRKSDWMNNFSLQPDPSLRPAPRMPNARD